MYFREMHVQVLLFASYADAFGASSIDVALDDGATVRDLLERVHQLAAGRRVPPSPAVAVNQEYAAPGQRIQAGDEVALIPPVAGG